MGGKAFSKGPAPLSTPRMPPKIYYRLQNHYLSLLSTLYVQASMAVEAPSKDSYGDVDILVSQSKFTSATPTNSLAKTLGAERTFTNSGSKTTSFALPYPNLPDNYVQVDVHVCSPLTFHWQVFHQSHGDLWNLLGTTIRPFGLTANDAGLHLRIAEIEPFNRKRSMILLTNEPKSVLGFLGLDAETYSRPFESVEAMCEYVVGCRLFRGETYVRCDLKANDRKRMAQREVYKRFVDAWLPKHDDLIRRRFGGEPKLTREDVCEVVLDQYAKREEYLGVLGEWRRERAELIAKREGRQKRKEDALELEEYANAWMQWLKHDTQSSPRTSGRTNC